MGDRCRLHLDAVVRKVPLAVLAASFALALPGTASAGQLFGPFGHGPAAVWLVLPRRPARRVVIFLHGWKIAPPSPSYPWVGQFRPWLDHLAGEGNAVLFPAYQTGEDGQGPARVTSLRQGLELGFAHLGARRRLPVVAAGYSYGASLAFSYASNARFWHLPQPKAVDAVFPAGPIPGSPLPTLAPAIQVLIQVGDRDDVAGRGGADAFWSWLAQRRGGRQRLVVVSSHPGFVADHAAPKLSTTAARAAFWSPLDALVERAAAS